MQKLFITVSTLLITTLSFVQSTIAETPKQFEAVAKVQETIGFQTSHSIGMSFQSLQDCQSETRKLNMVLENLRTQGIFQGGKVVSIACQQSQVIQIVSNNKP